MICAYFRLLVLGSVVVLIGGCGGGGGGSTGVGDSGCNTGGSTTTPGVVTFTITGATPTAVATQIGSGTLTASTLTSGSLTLSLPNGTTNFAVAFLCPEYLDSTIAFARQFVVEASTLDGNSFVEPCPVSSFGTSSSTPTGTLTGTVDAGAISGASQISLSVGSLYYGASQDVPFSVAAPTGADRVEVLAYNDGFGTAQSPIRLLAAKNFDNQTVPGALNGGNTVVFDSKDETSQESITYSGVPSGYPTPLVSASFATSGGLSFSLGIPATEYAALPARATESCDFYTVATTSMNTSVKPFGTVAVTKTFTAAAPVAIAFPSALSYAGPTPAALPTFNLSSTDSGFSGTTGAYRDMEISWPDPDALGIYTFDVYSVIATGNYLNGSASVSFPDLSGVPGFLAPPTSGTSVSWTASLFAGTYPSLQPAETNSTLNEVNNFGTYTVP